MVFFEIPITEGNENCVRFEPFGLMDGEHAHAIDHRAGYGFGRQDFVPMVQEIRKGRSMVLQIGRNLVEEISEISQLPCRVRLFGIAGGGILPEPEYPNQFLAEFVKRHGGEFGASARKFLRQGIQQRLAIVERHVGAIGFSQGSKRQFVIGIGQHAQRVNHNQHCGRSRQQKRLVGNKRYVFFSKSVYNISRLPFPADEYAHIAIRKPVGVQPLHLLRHFIEHSPALFFVFGRRTVL